MVEILGEKHLIAFQKEPFMMTNSILTYIKMDGAKIGKIHQQVVKGYNRI